MIRIVISCIAILSTIFYCVWEKNKTNTIMNENCIEVYLYEKPILPKNCIYLKELFKYSKVLKIQENFKYSKLVYDTINNELLHGGFFLKSNNNIAKVPLIQNSNIKSFNINSGKIELEIEIKLGKIPLPKDLNHLKQFVILKNQKPILSGYLYSIIASANLKNTNIIVYEINKSKTFTLLKVDSKNKFNRINLKKDYPQLYLAFKNTNRLIE